MGKIPVGQTIEQAYSFAFGKYFRLLGIVWLPLVVLAAIAHFLFWPHFLEAADFIGQIVRNHGRPDTGLVFWAGPFQWLRLFQIVALLVFIVIRVGVTKEALGLRSGPPFVYLSIGAAELRVVACYLILFAIAIAAVIVVVIGAIILGLVAGGAAAGLGAAKFDLHGMAGPGILLLVLLIVALYCAAIYVFVRLAFLMIPATVAESRIGIGRSWELTKGNFWRIFVIVIAVWLPLLILEGIVFSIVAGPVFAQLVNAAQSGPDAVHAQMAVLFKTMLADMPWFWGIGLLFSPIFFGLTRGPSAFAYRALVPGEAPASH